MNAAMQSPSTPPDWRRCAAHEGELTTIVIDGTPACRACMVAYTERLRAVRLGKEGEV